MQIGKLLHYNNRKKTHFYDESFKSR